MSFVLCFSLQDAHKSLVMETSGSHINDADVADEKAFSSLLGDRCMKDNTNAIPEFGRELLLQRNRNHGDTVPVCILALFQF